MRAIPASSAMALLIGMGLLAPGFLPAQEALQNSLAGEAASEAARLHPDTMPYNLKYGDFKLLWSPMLSLEYNDNVNNYNSSSGQSDFIVKPMLSLTASYPLTQRNLLQVNVTPGYLFYLDHDNLNSFYLASGSGLSFDMYVKDWLINLHDRLSYVKDGAQRGEITGTGDYAIFQNTAGVSGTWDMQDLVTVIGYDHLNYISLSDQFNQQTHSSESFLGRVGAKVNPRFTAGLEGTVSLTTYQEQLLNDNTSYGIGGYGDWRPGSHFNVQPRAGYILYDFSNSGSTTAAKNVDGWYFDVTLQHQPSDVFRYGLSFGHQYQLGVYSDLTERWYVRPNACWDFMKNLSLSGNFFYENGKQGGAALNRSLSQEQYDWYGTGVSLAYSPAKRLRVSLGYRLTLRASDASSRDYTQNVVSLLITYLP